MSKRQRPTKTSESTVSARWVKLRSKLGRRQVIGGLASIASLPVLGCGDEDEAPETSESPLATRDTAAGTPATPGDTATSSAATELEVPAWDDVPACTASNTDGAGQGPFFIHDEERDDDIELFRQDIRGRYDEAAEAGVVVAQMQILLDPGASVG